MADSTVTTEVRRLDHLRAMVDRLWDMPGLRALAVTDEASSRMPSGRNPLPDRTSTTDLAVTSPRKRTSTSSKKRREGWREIMLEMRKECLSFEIPYPFHTPFFSFRLCSLIFPGFLFLFFLV